MLRTESGIAASTGTQTATMTTAEETASPNYLGYLSTRYRVEVDVVRGVYTSTTYIREFSRAGGSGGLTNIANILRQSQWAGRFSGQSSSALLRELLELN